MRGKDGVADGTTHDYPPHRTVAAPIVPGRGVETMPVVKGLPITDAAPEGEIIDTEKSSPEKLAKRSLKERLIVPSVIVSVTAWATPVRTVATANTRTAAIVLM